MFDAAYLRKHLPTHEKYGVFARVPDMRDFMTCDRACATGIRIQQEFEVRHNKRACKDIIVAYQRGGGIVKSLRSTYAWPATCLPRVNHAQEIKQWEE